jgi:hypothetical protein
VWTIGDLLGIDRNPLLSREFNIRHAGAGRHPSSLVLQGQKNWIPVFAEMTTLVSRQHSS